MLVVSRDSALYAVLDRLAAARRAVFFTGLPGMGKSLMIQQLAHLASAAGRRIHLLQWDVARPVFEASPAGRRHPVVDGVTQPMIRVAVGRWARRAVSEWSRRCVTPEHLLVGEAPFVGHRLIDLARRARDEAEPILSSPACVFAIAVPSVDVRTHIEAERGRRASAPNHPREREDAPPHVLGALWRELVVAARALGIAPTDDETAYDPVTYRRVYAALLRHRTTEVVALDVVLPTTAMSVYELAVPCVELVPDDDEADALVREAEARHPDLAALAKEVERWWVV
jgi:hypothetical protein